MRPDLAAGTHEPPADPRAAKEARKQESVEKPTDERTLRACLLRDESLAEAIQRLLVERDAEVRVIEVDEREPKPIRPVSVREHS